MKPASISHREDNKTPHKCSVCSLAQKIHISLELLLMLMCISPIALMGFSVTKKALEETKWHQRETVGTNGSLMIFEMGDSVKYCTIKVSRQKGMLDKSWRRLDQAEALFIFLGQPLFQFCIALEQGGGLLVSQLL